MKVFETFLADELMGHRYLRIFSIHHSDIFLIFSLFYVLELSLYHVPDAVLGRRQRASAIGASLAQLEDMTESAPLAARGAAHSATPSEIAATGAKRRRRRRRYPHCNRIRNSQTSASCYTDYVT